MRQVSIVKQDKITQLEGGGEDSTAYILLYRCVSRHASRSGFEALIFAPLIHPRALQRLLSQEQELGMILISSVPKAH